MGALYECLRQVTCIYYCCTSTVRTYMQFTTHASIPRPLTIHPIEEKKNKTLSLPTHPIPRRHTIRRRQLGRIPPHRLSPIPTNGTLPTPRTPIQRARRICRRSFFDGHRHVVFGTVFVHEIFFNLENKFGGGISGICVWGDAREVTWGERVGLAGGPAGWWGGSCPANGAVSRIGTSLFKHCFGVGDGEADVVGFRGYADVAGDEGVEVEVEGLGGGCECGEGGEKLFGGEHGCSFFFSFSRCCSSCCSCC